MKVSSFGVSHLVAAFAAFLATTAAFNNALAAPGDPGDPNIKYVGRWDFSNPTQYSSFWGGSYLKVKFTGTTAKIKVGNTTNYHAKIDSGPWKTYVNASGTINLTPTPLASGTHSLIVAEGRDYVYDFRFQGLVFDSGATTSAPTVSPNIIEFIGDSITAGYTNDQADICSYAWVCSENLGAEHTQIAFPGIALVTGYGLNSDKTGMDAQYFRAQPPTSSTAWDFTKYTAKLVVLNIGQNDTATDSLVQSTMTTFLANIRAKYANADIFVMRPFTGNKAAPIQAAANARIGAGDSKVHYIDTTGWLTAGSSDYNDAVHPSISGHIKAANLLQPILAPYLNGTVGVTFYQDTGYGGTAGQPLTPGTYTTAQLAAKGVPSDWASSAQIPSGWTVTMYANDNQTGTSWTLTGSTSSFIDLSPNANDQMSSCTIQTGGPVGVTFYQDFDYGGASSQVLPVGNYTTAQLAAKGVPNDWASSVRVSSGRTVIMYAGDNFTGTSWTRTADTPSFGTLSPNANDQLSSCKVQ